MFNILDFQKGDIQRQLTLFLTGAMILLLFPMAFYRLAKGEVLHCVIDLVMFGIASFVFYRAWRYQLNTALNYVSVFAFMLTISLLIYLKGVDMIYWLFPGMIGVYFLLISTSAFWVNSAFICIDTVLLLKTMSQEDSFNIYPSLLLVLVFGFILSRRSEFQNTELFKLASLDPLTGVENRRSFDDHVQIILANYNRLPNPVCMLVLDLDLFKKVNDLYGHKKGDFVLVEFASKVNSLIRNTDHIYRFGGEEFVVIANNSSLKSAGKLAELIRKYIADCPHFIECDVTVSIGVSELMASDNSDSWFKRADSALYEAKRSGRNKVVLAEQSENNDVCFKNFDDSKILPAIKSKKHSLIRSEGEVDAHLLLDKKKSAFHSDSLA